MEDSVMKDKETIHNKTRMPQPSRKLIPTLQIRLGMVIDNGVPCERPLPKLPASLTNVEPILLSPLGFATERQNWEYIYADVFPSCVLGKRLPLIDDGARSSFEVSKFSANVYACCREDVGLETMKRYIYSRKRLDLEQAAALVLSAIVNDAAIPARDDIVRCLINRLDCSVLKWSCMWINDVKEDSSSKFSRFAKYVQRLVESNHAAGVPGLDNMEVLVEVLIKVRRYPSSDRCLFIPEWMFKAADIPVPTKFRAWGNRGMMGSGRYPISQTNENTIVLSRKSFRKVQRRLLRYFRFWIPVLIFRNDVKDPESDVLYCSDHIKSKMTDSKDTFLVAHYFFAFQRRLQPKVVSDVDWTRFLAKGETMKIYQNNPSIISTFEEKLSELSGCRGLTTSKGVITQQIDRCCLLMEAYVLLYGGGDQTKLRFSPDVKGGSGRGDVDWYNVLCNILGELRRAAVAAGLEAPPLANKFLAKDIMAWNSSFVDDAFADEKVPGWEIWLVKRRAEGSSIV